MRYDEHSPSSSAAQIGERPARAPFEVGKIFFVGEAIVIIVVAQVNEANDVRDFGHIRRFADNLGRIAPFGEQRRSADAAVHVFFENPRRLLRSFIRARVHAPYTEPCQELTDDFGLRHAFGA